MFDALLELFERKNHARPDDRKRGWRDRLASVVGDDDDGNDRHRSTRRDWDDDDDRGRRSDRRRGRFDGDFD